MRPRSGWVKIPAATLMRAARGPAFVAWVCAALFPPAAPAANCPYGPPNGPCQAGAAPQRAMPAQRPTYTPPPVQRPTYTPPAVPRTPPVTYTPPPATRTPPATYTP